MVTTEINLPDDAMEQNHDFLRIMEALKIINDTRAKLFQQKFDAAHVKLAHERGTNTSDLVLTEEDKEKLAATADVTDEETTEIITKIVNGKHGVLHPNNPFFRDVAPEDMDKEVQNVIGFLQRNMKDGSIELPIALLDDKSMVAGEDQEKLLDSEEKDDDKTLDKEEIKDASTDDRLFAKLQESAEDCREKEPQKFFELVIGILQNDKSPDFNKYLWATQQLMHAEAGGNGGVRYRVTELHGKQQVEFSVKFPGLGETTFKTVCFREQQHMIHDHTPLHAQDNARRIANRDGTNRETPDIEQPALVEKDEEGNIIQQPARLNETTIETKDGNTQHERFARLKQDLGYDKSQHAEDWVSLDHARATFVSAVISVYDIPDIESAKQLVKPDDDDTIRKPK